jgi:predicted secreted acid phosphatase
MKKVIVYCFVLVLILPGCCTSELTNLRDLKQAIIKYHESGKYDRDVNDAVSHAKEEFSKVDFTNGSVVIFDIDETALQNYEINKALDFGYISEPWHNWVLEAKAPAIRQVKELYDYLIIKGSKIIFITGRPLKEYEASKKNLLTQGYTQFDTIITRLPEEGSLTALEFKTGKRTLLVRKGYRIEGTVGDQWSDLEGNYHGIQVKLPNYIYKID